MLADKALELLRELQRCPDSIPSFKEDGVRQIIEEMNHLFEANREDVAAGDVSYFSGVHLRHAALERNKRCLIVYVYQRLLKLRQTRWELGSVLPPDIKENLCEPEVLWFSRYNKNLAMYMKSVSRGTNLNLTQDLQPPKSSYVEVRCTSDYGEFETDNGDIILLKKGSQYLLPRTDCQHLIYQGILEHVK